MNNRDEVISLGISKSDYSKMADKASPNSPKLLNAVKAFLFGGGICLLGQLLNTLFESIGLGERQVRLATPAVLIVATAVLTGIGVFDKIARQAGAGTIVPITGFANAVVSPALEFQHEGFVLGTAAQMFSIAGPVLVYGVTTSVLYGLILFCFSFVLKGRDDDLSLCVFDRRTDLYGGAAVDGSDQADTCADFGTVCVSGSGAGRSGLVS